MDDFLGWLCLAAIVAGLCWAFNSARQENRWQQVERLQEEVDRLRRRSIWMEEQLRAGGWIPGPAEPPPARPSVYSPPREAQGPPPQPAATIPVARVSPVPPAPAVASRAPEPARVALPQVSPSRPVPPAKPAPQPGPTWEDRIGGQWFNWLGAVTAVFAVGLFLKWAYDMGWITPMLHLPPLAYLTLGWLVGTVLLAAGDRLRRPLPLYAQGIAGAGIATLYVTTYAGHALYGTLSPTAATVGLVAVGTAAIGMALRHNSRVIGWIGLVLAYVSPVLLGVPSGSPLSLFLYLSALNAAVLGISVARHWPPFRAAAFAATAVLYAVWYSTQYSMPHLGAALAFVGANALLFLGVVVLYPLVRRERSHDTDLAVAVLNPLLAFTGIHALLAPHHSQCLGLVALGSGGVYWLAARAIGLRRGEPDYLEQLFFSTALVFAVLAVPLQFQGRAVTAGWALIGAALSVVGFRTASLRTRVWGAVALALSLGRLALMDAWQAPSPGAAPFFNERSFSFGVVALALAAMAGVVVREWKDAGRKGETRSALMCALLGVLGIVMDVWVALDAPSPWIPVGWSVLAALALALGWQLRSGDVRAVAAPFAALPVLLAMLEPAHLSLGPSWPLPGCIAALALCVGAAVAYQRADGEGQSERWISPLYGGAAAILLMVRAAMDLPPFWVVAAWAAVALGAVCIGFLTRSAGHRLVGVAVGAAATGCLHFSYGDAAQLGTLWVLGSAAAAALVIAASAARPEGAWTRSGGVGVAACAAVAALLWCLAESPHPWATHLWMVAALVALVLWAQAPGSPYRLVLAAVAGVTLSRLAGGGIGPTAGDLLTRAPAFAGCAALWLSAMWLYRRTTGLEAAETDAMLPASAGAAAAVALAWGATELGRGWLPLSWLAVAALLLWAGVVLNRASLRILGLAVAVLLTGEVLGRELFLPGGHAAVWHSRTVASIALLGCWAACAAVFARYGGEGERKLLPGLLLAVNLQALGWLSLEGMDIGSRLRAARWAAEAAQFGLSAVWVLYAAAAIGVGFRWRLQAARWGGILLMLLVVAKVYLFDLGFLALGYRVLSFVVLALVLLGVSYLYQRQGSSGRMPV